MDWVKSKLFWRIAGLYTALSFPALAGLLLTVRTQVQSEAIEHHQQAIFRSLDEINSELESGKDAEQVIAFRRSVPGTAYRQLWLVNEQVRPLTSGADLPPADITLQSVVAASIRFGYSVRRVRLEGRELFAFGVTVRRNGSVILALTSADSVAARFQAVLSAATRSAVFMWFTGILCVALIATGVVNSVRVMARSLDQSVERLAREDQLLAISDRRDELGELSGLIRSLETERNQQISQLHKAEQTARSSAQLLSTVLDSMVEGVLAVDETQRIVFINSGARRLLAINTAIGVGHRLYEAVRVPAFLDTMAAALSERKMQTLEYRASREPLVLVVVVVPIASEPMGGAVAVVRDVSELRRVEAMRRDFVSGVSHELKTPLTVIQACTDTLLGGALSDPEAAERFLRQIESQSERLLQLILGMLQLARVESGQQLLHIEPVAVHEVINHVVSAFQPVADGRGVQLQRAGDRELVIKADTEAVQTILSNLVDNALKHTESGGAVTIELNSDAVEPAVIVRDGGSGIPEQVLNRIFERFYRVERDRSRERGGVGLGLAIVKHLCNAIGATITATSAPGEGSQFCVRFRAD